jgi:hypothetical protein
LETRQHSQRTFWHASPKFLSRKTLLVGSHKQGDKKSRALLESFCALAVISPIDEHTISRQLWEFRQSIADGRVFRIMSVTVQQKSSRPVAARTCGYWPKIMLAPVLMRQRLQSQFHVDVGRDQALCDHIMSICTPGVSCGVWIVGGDMYLTRVKDDFSTVRAAGQ